MVVNGYIIALLIIAAFIAIAYALHKKGILQKYGMELYGPFIMWKTKRGRELIDRTARKRRHFWERYADFSLGIILFFMAFGTILLIWIATLVSRIPASRAPNPEMMLGIPGINPIIPVWYGILGLAVAIVFHEFSHGILARVAKVKIKSLGLLFFIFPVGAFVEPDEDEVGKLPKRKRMRMYAVGPSANIFLAIIFALLFIGMVGQAQPIHEGVVVYGAYENTPASDTLAKGMEIIDVNGTAIKSPEDLDNAPLPPANHSVEIGVMDGRTERILNITSGLVIIGVTEGYAASDAGIKAGMIIDSLNDTAVHNYSDFISALSLIKPGQEVNISLYERNGKSYTTADIHTIKFTEEDKYSYYAKYLPSENREEYRGKAIMGVAVSTFGIYGVDAGAIPKMLAHPFWGDRDADDFIRSSLSYTSLPLSGIVPVEGKMSEIYSFGALDFLPPQAFWILANSFYWIFWLNLMVGITNALPAVPLDGGYIFRDGIGWMIERLRKGMSRDKVDNMASGISTAMALLILFLILWQIIGPRMSLM